jgi:hypothetical protein
MKLPQVALLLAVITLSVVGSGCSSNCTYTMTSCVYCQHVITYIEDSTGTTKTAFTIAGTGGSNVIISDCRQVTGDTYIDDGSCCSGIA